MCWGQHQSPANGELDSVYTKVHTQVVSQISSKGIREFVNTCGRLYLLYFMLDHPTTKSVKIKSGNGNCRFES